jgi:hypothetical protein
MSSLSHFSSISPIFRRSSPFSAPNFCPEFDEEESDQSVEGEDSPSLPPALDQIVNGTRVLVVGAGKEFILVPLFILIFDFVSF